MKINKVNATGTAAMPLHQIPEDFAAEPIAMSSNAEVVFSKRYLRKNEQGHPIETIQEAVWRVAWYVACAETFYGATEEQVLLVAREFYTKLLHDFTFVPNSPTWTGAGGSAVGNSTLGQLAACFVLPVEDDLGKTSASIFETLRNAASIQQGGGGLGFSFSKLRPNGDVIKSSKGIATGPLGFIETYDRAFRNIQQGGTRRGANLACLNVSHPDIEAFIDSKRDDEEKLTAFNISVGITDDFMAAVEQDLMWPLINPRTGEIVKTVSARGLFSKIAESAHASAEPGLLFLDTANRANPLPHMYELETTNPCFPGDELVSTVDGPVAFKELAKRGEALVFCMIDGKTTIRRMTNIHKTRNNVQLVKITYGEQNHIRCTPDHKFYTRNGQWIEAQHLEQGDQLYSNFQIYEEIQAIHHVVSVELCESEDVYNGMVEEAHNYFICDKTASNGNIASGVLVKNCGEQFLGPYENCCLGSINLANIAMSHGKIDWKQLRDIVKLATRFLDDVVDANQYVPSVPQLAEAAHNARRIGLSIMGLADVLYKLRIRYGSSRAQSFAAQLMEFITYTAMETSIDIATEKGAFPVIEGSIYDPKNLVWTAPVNTLQDGNFGRPKLDWNLVEFGIKQWGIRNCDVTTIAPTGTVATVAGCEGYGCEPVFALGYTRYVNDNGAQLQLGYTSPLFEEALIASGLDETLITNIIREVQATGSCQNVKGVPHAIQEVFVGSSDISATEHVMMQAALQAFTTNSISKTINMHEDSTVKDVYDAYFLAWQQKCKGVTVYVTGSRKKVVLETKKKEKPTEIVLHRPAVLEGKTFQVATRSGMLYITINEVNNEPIEVFVNASKAGSEVAAVSEAIGRLCSLVLRLQDNKPRHQRLHEIIKQLQDIGGQLTYGYGKERITSLADAIARGLIAYEENNIHGLNTAQNGRGDFCPECGMATLIREEGCAKCTNCSYSVC